MRTLVLLCCLGTLWLSAGCGLLLVGDPLLGPVDAGDGGVDVADGGVDVADGGADALSPGDAGVDAGLPEILFLTCLRFVPCALPDLSVVSVEAGTLNITFEGGALLVSELAGDYTLSLILKAGIELAVDLRVADNRSCAFLANTNRDLTSGVFALLPAGELEYRAHCDLETGFALALKIDGTNPTFAFESALWTDASVFGEDDETQTEAKRPTFSRLPADRIRLETRMQGTGDRGQIELALEATTTLQQLFLDGPTAALGTREEWLSAFPGASLQGNCNRSGVNVERDQTPEFMRVRLGMLGNNEDECISPDSRVGIGGGSSCAALCGFGFDFTMPTAGSMAAFASPLDRGHSAFVRVLVRDEDFTTLSPAPSCEDHRLLGRHVPGVYLLNADPGRCFDRPVEVNCLLSEPCVVVLDETGDSVTGDVAVVLNPTGDQFVVTPDAAGRFNVDVTSLDGRTVSHNIVVADNASCALLANTALGRFPKGVYPLGASGARGYCRTDEGWSLALFARGDDAESEFDYDNSLWTDTTVFNAEVPSEDDDEKKLPAFFEHKADLVRVVVEMQSLLVGELAFRPPETSSLRALFASAVDIDIGDADTTDLIALFPGADAVVDANVCGTGEINNEHPGSNAEAVRLGAIFDDGECFTPNSRVGIGTRGTRLANPTVGYIRNNDTSQSGRAWIYVLDEDFTSLSAAVSCAAHAQRGRFVPGRYLVGEVETRCFD